MGFAEDLDAILEATPAERQTALFSATMPARILSIAERHLQEPGARHDRAREDRRPASCRASARSPTSSRRAHKPAALERVLDIGESGVGAGVLPDAARSRHAGRDAERARPPRRSAARRHGAAPARSRDGAVPRRQGRSARRHRRRGARPRHRAALARHQLRRARVAGGLRAPHRPHRARRARRARRSRWPSRASTGCCAASKRRRSRRSRSRRCRRSPICARSGSSLTRASLRERLLAGQSRSHARRRRSRSPRSSTSSTSPRPRCSWRTPRSAATATTRRSRPPARRRLGIGPAIAGR